MWKGEKLDLLSTICFLRTFDAAWKKDGWWSVGMRRAILFRGTVILRNWKVRLSSPAMMD